LETAPSGEALHDLKRTMQQQQKNNRPPAYPHRPAWILATAEIGHKRCNNRTGRKRSRTAKNKTATQCFAKNSSPRNGSVREFDLLQQKLAEVEERAGRADALALELDDMHQAYEHLKTEATRNAEKLKELWKSENTRTSKVAALEEELLGSKYPTPAVAKAGSS
jgi:hypothetical protein